MRKEIVVEQAEQKAMKDKRHYKTKEAERKEKEMIRGHLEVSEEYADVPV